MMALPQRVRIVEVGPRDGLQNEPGELGIETRIGLVERLTGTGLAYIEAGSFVSPKWVPKMAGSGELLKRVHRGAGVTYAALTPNLRGLEDALASDADEVAVFAAASETFSERNINCSVAESLARFEPVLQRAREAGVPVRGYLSTVIACPYEGYVPAERVAELADQLYRMGCREISLGDTIGRGTPGSVTRMIESVAQRVPVEHLAVHFHDTYGQALANILACLQLGVAVVDSAVAGLGGCPYAAGASGNVATEDVVYMLDGLGIGTGVDFPLLCQTGAWIAGQLGRANQSRAGQAWLAANAPPEG